MDLERFDKAGKTLWTKSLNFGGTQPWIDKAGKMMGGGRLAFGNGMYGAYHTTYGVEQKTGHDGDQLRLIRHCARATATCR